MCKNKAIDNELKHSFKVKTLLQKETNRTLTQETNTKKETTSLKYARSKLICHQQDVVKIKQKYRKQY